MNGVGRIFTRTTFLLVLLLGDGISCTPSEPWTADNPEYALNSFLSALRNGDRDTVWEYLSEETRAMIVENNRQNRIMLGGETDQSASDALADLYRVWTPSALEIERIELVERSGDSATVALHSVFGSQQNVEMVRSHGRWTLDLTFDENENPRTGGVEP